MALSAAVDGGRAKVALAVLLVAAAGGAAAYVATGGFGASDGGDDVVRTVPAGVDAVVYADAGIARDPTTETLVNGVIDVAQRYVPFYAGPDSYRDALGDLANGSAADLRALQSVAVFGRYPAGNVTLADGLDGQYVGVLVASEWSPDEFRALLGNRSFERRTYEGYTVLVAERAGAANGSLPARAPPTWVGVLGDGRFVVGSPSATRDAIDVHRGAAPAFGGELRAQYRATRTDGYLRFAARVPADRLPDVGTSRQFQAVRGIDTVGGSYYAEGSAVGVRVRMTAGADSNPEELATIVQAGVTLAEQRAAAPEVATLLDNVTVQQSGADVVVTLERPAPAVVAALEGAAEARLGGFPLGPLAARGAEPAARPSARA